MENYLTLAYTLLKQRDGVLLLQDFLLMYVVLPVLHKEPRPLFQGVLIVVTTGHVLTHSQSIKPGIDVLFHMVDSLGSFQ